MATHPEQGTARDTAQAAVPLELSASLRSSGVIAFWGVGAGRVGFIVLR
jgi:hypothetical protein